MMSYIEQSPHFFMNMLSKSKFDMYCINTFLHRPNLLLIFSKEIEKKDKGQKAKKPTLKFIRNK